MNVLQSLDMEIYFWERQPPGGKMGIVGSSEI